MPSLLLTTSALGVILPNAFAILVTPNSPCSTDCGNVLDSTSGSDIVCLDESFAGETGQLFQTCLECEMTSGYHKDNDSDTQSFLYNVRFAVSSCLWGVPHTKNMLQNSPCITSKACAPFEKSIELGKLDAKLDSYEYCDVWDEGDLVDLKGCTDCLQAQDNYYMANFVTALQAGCLQKPEPGVTVALEGDIFSDDLVKVTDPTPMAKVDPAWFDHGALNLGAKVGIAVGGFVFLLIVLGFFIVWNGKRRRRAYLRRLETKYGQNGWPSPQQPGDKTETPLSQRPLRGWDDSPLSANTEKNFPRYISPYSSQYTSPVSAIDTTNMPWPQMAMGKPQNIGLAIGDNGDDNRRGSASVSGKGKMVEESYEMNEVESSAGRQGAPILNHPGYGRNTPSPPREYIPTSEGQYKDNNLL